MSDLLDWMNILQGYEELPSHIRSSICVYCKRKPASGGHSACRPCAEFYQGYNQTALDSKGYPQNQYAYDREQAEARHRQGL